MRLSQEILRAEVAGKRQQQQQSKRNTEGEKKKRIVKERARWKGDAFFLSFHFVHLSSTNADPSNPSPAHTPGNNNEKKNEK